MLKLAFDFVHIAFEFVQKAVLFEFVRICLNLYKGELSGNCRRL